MRYGIYALMKRAGKCYIHWGVPTLCIPFLLRNWGRRPNEINLMISSHKDSPHCVKLDCWLKEWGRFQDLSVRVRQEKQWMDVFQSFEILLLRVRNCSSEIPTNRFTVWMTLFDGNGKLIKPK